MLSFLRKDKLLNKSSTSTSTKSFLSNHIIPCIILKTKETKNCTNWLVHKNRFSTTRFWIWSDWNVQNNSFFLGLKNHQIQPKSAWKRLSNHSS